MMPDHPPYTQFVVQTLMDSSWRSFDRFAAEAPAQKIAAALIPEWGAQRVRLLGGYFSPEKGRNVYYQLAIQPPARAFLPRVSANSRFALGSTALGLAMLMVVLLISHMLLPISPVAADGKGPERTLSVLAPIAPIAKPVDLRARFAEVAKLPHARVRDFDTVPLRLRGPWGTACNADGGEMVLDAKALSHRVEGEPVAPLTSVWQTGQRYGLVQSDGSIRLVGLISADRLQMIGTMNRLGDFTADPAGAILTRCL
ncbi:hypothetical protein [Sneathiella sp.]|uniref:hypothetical protein n=1 Tax=Sneathiella sp. TaxID=1964365 RepID=UPI002FDFD2A3